MDQVKIGSFIAALRKEQSMTQKQLAEQVGVSDKTISKWECGNGLPEMSSIPVLCEVLGINMNELLSGERLAEETYSMKAEENMMTLMQETVEQKKKNKNSMVTLVLSLAAVIAAFVLSNFFLFMDKEFSIWIFFDLGTFLVILLPTVIIMVAARQGKAFFRAFTMLGDSTRYTKEQRRESKAAVKLAANSMLVLGFMSCVATLPYLGGSYSQDGMEMEELIANATVALYGILYGLAAYLLLLPVCSRLEAVMEE